MAAFAQMSKSCKYIFMDRPTTAPYHERACPLLSRCRLLGACAGNYVVVFDPLDGSSNIDAGISTGSIFGIYAPSEECR